MTGWFSLSQKATTAHRNVVAPRIGNRARLTPQSERQRNLLRREALRQLRHDQANDAFAPELFEA